MDEYVLKIHDVIPLSSLARHGNFEYILGKERRFAFEDMFRDFSVFEEPDDNETWLHDTIEEECHRLASYSLQKEQKPFPKYLLTYIESEALNSNDGDFDVTLLPASIDDVEESVNDDEATQKYKTSPTCGLDCCSQKICYDESPFVYALGSASIWTEPLSLLDECKLCADEYLEPCRKSSSATQRQELYRQLFDVVETSGALFPREFELPHAVDPDELNEALQICLWKECINEDNKRRQRNKALFQTFENNSKTSPTPHEEFTKTVGLAIPVYMKPPESYNPHARDSGKGVNFRNLILLSPQSLRNRGERSWWRHYGAVNKPVASAELKCDLKVTEEVADAKTGGPKSRRRLYSDVLTTSPSSPSASHEGRQESAEQSPTINTRSCSTQIYYADCINRFLSDFPALSPYVHSPNTSPLQSKSLGSSPKECFT